MKDGRYPTVLLFGAPGVGKGTQGKLLGQVPGFTHVASGDIFRSLDRHSDLGRKFHEYSSRGLLVPDEVTVSVWKAHMQRSIDAKTYRPGMDLLLLDGIPRNVTQCRAMDPSLEVLRVVHLVASSVDALVGRLLRRAVKEGRFDDADEAVIRKRFDVYREETAPVLSYYDRTLLSDVVAEAPPAEVLMHVLEAIVPACRGRIANPLD
jgi:adenylate kinase